MKILTIRKVLLLAGMSLSTLILPGYSHAKGYQFDSEITGALTNSEIESGVVENNYFQLKYSVFDQPVGYGDYPYLLTNFFERRTRLDFSYANVQSEPGVFESSGDSFGVNYVFASVRSPILFNLGAGRLEGEGNDPIGDFENEAIAFYFGFGYYVSPNSIASISVSAIDHTIKDDAGPDFDYDETQLEVSWQHVLKVDDEKYLAVLLDVKAIEIGSVNNSNVGIFVDYYINRRVSIGAGYSVTRGDLRTFEEGIIAAGSPEGETLSFTASLFTNEQFGFVGRVGRYFSDLADSDEDNIYLEAIARFN